VTRAVLDGDVPSLGVPKPVKALPERLGEGIGGEPGRRIPMRGILTPCWASAASGATRSVRVRSRMKTMINVEARMDVV
jgi:hypothetical protein